MPREARARTADSYRPDRLDEMTNVAKQKTVNTRLVMQSSVWNIQRKLADRPAPIKNKMPNPHLGW